VTAAIDLKGVFPSGNETASLLTVLGTFGVSEDEVKRD
jgi:hypothetical protein